MIAQEKQLVVKVSELGSQQSFAAEEAFHNPVLIANFVINTTQLVPPSNLTFGTALPPVILGRDTLAVVNLRCVCEALRPN